VTADLDPADLDPRVPLDLTAHLRTHRILAIVRADSAAYAVSAARVLVRSGIWLLEVSLTTPDAVVAIREIVDELGNRALVGAGTVLTPDHVVSVADAGARFAVTPARTSALEAAVAADLPVLCGAATPTEILAAREAGADAIKLFPAGPTGVDTVAALRGPFPDLEVVPVGGVRIDSVPAYARAGALAVGVGSPLLGDAAHGEDLEGLAQRSEVLVRAAEVW
jgi:2-dehydro-3-deoxyphosphogluconate aldolase/(4S)-4-hydroxy-2-oxoglutarate aldolase